MRTRFAPSPTGFLHVGNVRTALIAYMYAKSNDGDFILRIDDTDAERSKERFEEALKRDLLWLGIKWDETFNQSTRMEEYTAAMEKLISSGRLYKCYETREELELKRKMALNMGRPPIYDRSALNTPSSDIPEGRSPHWRFLLKDEEISWNDHVCGPISFDAKNLSDPILVREDGSMTYSLASVVDDIDFKITHIVRGEDHITNSAMHRQLFEALGAPPPDFAHLPLLKSADGKLSKRIGGGDINGLRETGIHPMVVTSYLAKIGTSENIEVYDSMEELVKSFNILNCSRSSALYSNADIERLNYKFLSSKPYNEIKQMLPASCTEKIWNIISKNISSVEDLNSWLITFSDEFYYDVLSSNVCDKKFIEDAVESLAGMEWTQDIWKDWTKELASSTKKGGKDLYLPLRLTITGRHNGPEMNKFMLYFGKNEILSRLHKALSHDNNQI